MPSALSSGLARFVTRSILGLPAFSALAPSVLPDRVLGRVRMTVDTLGLPGVDGGEPLSTQDIDASGNRLQMVGDTGIVGHSDAQRVPAEMIDVHVRFDRPMRVNPGCSMRKTRSSLWSASVTELPISRVGVCRGCPLPARTKIGSRHRHGAVLVHLDPEAVIASGQVVRTDPAHSLVVHRAHIKPSVLGLSAFGKYTTRHERQLTPREGVVMGLISPLGDM